MPCRSWTLTDTERDVYVDALQLGPADAPGASNFSLRKRTLRGGLRDGLDAIEVDNGCLRFTVLPGRGMGLWRVWRGELEVGWPSPVKGPVHPKFVPTDEGSGIGWLRGFDELLCRCGLEYNGAPEWSADGKLKHPLHGRIANLPAHLVEVTIDSDSGELSVTGVIDETRLFGNNLRLKSTVRTKIGEPKLTVIDEVINAWATPADLELLYHINVGPPLAAPARSFRRRSKRWRREMTSRPAIWRPGKSSHSRSRVEKRRCCFASWLPTKTAAPARCWRPPTGVTV